MYLAKFNMKNENEKRFDNEEILVWLILNDGKINMEYIYKSCKGD